MRTAWLLLMLNGLFFTLRLANNTGSFPRALTREEDACNGLCLRNFSCQR